jgi:hypothetical protein
VIALEERYDEDKRAWAAGLFDAEDQTFLAGGMTIPRSARQSRKRTIRASSIGSGR